MEKRELAFSADVARAAATRWREAAAARERKLESGAREGAARADDPDRVMKRAERLMGKLRSAEARRDLPRKTRAVIDTISAAPFNLDVAERIIGETRDFLAIDFLDRAIRAARPVGRLVTRLGGGRVRFGTGFMVSPRLLMTNHHVLPREDDARITRVEFDFQTRFGVDLPPVRFNLRPELFFLNHQPLDFALVAVEPNNEGGAALRPYGWCPLIETEGKILVSDPVNIVQHPSGRMKEIVIRQNRLLDLPHVSNDEFAHYEADTEPGSSGSPVFNDEWEVIALHHSGVPKTNDRGELIAADGSVWREGDDPERLAWVANEGIRVSALVKFIRAAQLRNSGEVALREELLKAAEPAVEESGAPVTMPQSKTAGDARLEDDWEPPLDTGSGFAESRKPRRAVSLTIPLTITVSVGEPDQPTDIVTRPDAGVSRATLPAAEAIEPDPDYSNRPGYNPNFLPFPAPMPQLTGSASARVLEVDGGRELKYHHYSVIMNRERKLAFVAAVNYHAGAKFRHARDGADRWFLDPRAQGAQAGEELYRGNPLDRGHLVRRADAAWGDTKEEAKLANDDTFHFTNCSPQHEIFNQATKATARNLKLWGNLEEHLAAQAARDKERVSVFNGPVFRDNDRLYRGVKLPREYFKVILFENDQGQPRALAFVLSQDSLIRNLPAEEFEFNGYSTFQISVRDLERRTGLDFGALKGFDPLERRALESGGEARSPSEITGFEQILL